MNMQVCRSMMLRNSIIMSEGQASKGTLQPLIEHLVTYCRTAFNCKNLIIGNVIFFSSLQTFESQTYSINSPTLRAICADAIIKFGMQLKRDKRSYAIKTAPTVLSNIGLSHAQYMLLIVTGSKLQPVLNYAQLHTLTQATCSYVLLQQLLLE